MSRASCPGHHHKAHSNPFRAERREGGKSRVENRASCSARPARERRRRQGDRADTAGQRQGDMPMECPLPLGEGRLRCFSTDSRVRVRQLGIRPRLSAVDSEPRTQNLFASGMGNRKSRIGSLVTMARRQSKPEGRPRRYSDSALGLTDTVPSPLPRCSRRSPWAPTRS